MAHETVFDGKPEAIEQRSLAKHATQSKGVWYINFFDDTPICHSSF